MKLKKTNLAMALALIGFVPALAWSADTNASTEQLERITVTGSNIKRINREGPTPVEVIKKADIEKSGASTVIQLLDRLPSVSGVLAGTNSGSFAAGAATAGLRGMSSKYVLILLNGRRITNYGMAISGTDTFVDLNSLPLSVIESVEILRDGASAIYGSDAVAGVINFKTKKNYQGFETSARYGQTADGDGMEQAVNISAGFGNLEEDGRNLLLSLDTYHRDPVFTRKHKATKTNDYRSLGGDDNRTGAMWGYWRDAKLVNHPLPGCDPSRLESRSSGDFCVADVDIMDPQLSPRTSRVGLMANYTQKLGGNSELFVEAGYNRTETKLDGGYQFIQQTIDKTWKIYPSAGYLSPTGPFTGAEKIRITRYLNENGKSYNQVNSDTYRVVTGLRTTLKEWDIEGSLNMGYNKVSMASSNVILGTPFLNAMKNGVNGQVVYNPFLVQSSGAGLAQFQTSNTNEGISRLDSFELKAANSELTHFAAGPVGFAAGLQWNHESMNSIPGDLIQSGQLMNYAVQEKLKASRSVFSVYGEFSLPVAKDVEVQLALRSDHYNDFGDSLNPKFAFSWKPYKEILVRGSATTSFKAPTLPQLYATRQAYTNLYDYAQCEKKNIKCTSASTQIRSGGNPNLKPERSNNFSLGFVLEPIKDLSASFDWYMIDQSDTVQSLDAQYVLDHADRFPGQVVRKTPDLPNIPGDIDYVSAPYMNLGSTRIEGMDIDIRYDVSLGRFGKLTFREAQNRTFSYKDTPLATDPMRENVDFAPVPRWKNILDVTYAYGDYSLGVTMRTYASTKNKGSVEDPDTAGLPERIPSYSAFDVNFSAKPIKKLTVNAGIKNIGNRIPPYGTGKNAVGYVGPSTEVWGRTFYLGGSYAFK